MNETRSAKVGPIGIAHELKTALAGSPIRRYYSSQLGDLASALLARFLKLVSGGAARTALKNSQLTAATSPLYARRCTTLRSGALSSVRLTKRGRPFQGWPGLEQGSCCGAGE